MRKYVALFMFGAIAYSLGSFLASATREYDVEFVFWILVFPVVYLSRMIVRTTCRSIELGSTLHSSLGEELFELKASSKSLFHQISALLRPRKKSFGPFANLRVAYEGGSLLWKAQVEGVGLVAKFSVVMDIESSLPTKSQEEFVRHFSQNVIEIRDACENKLSASGRIFRSPLIISSVAVPACGKVDGEWSVLLSDSFSEIKYLVEFSNGEPSSVSDSSDC